MRWATVMLALVVVLVAAPAWADYEAGKEAYVRGDYATALKEFRALAAQGDADAQSALGWMYYEGEGVSQDDAEAVRWYLLAAAQGEADAQGNLGAMYAVGRGVPQNDAEAVQWFRRAAAKENSSAQYDLGFMYEHGRGVPQNFLQALFWYNLAAARGNKDAGLVRDDLARKMTPAQIAEAQRLAREWKPK